MTNQDINRICTQYLNDCESELEVQDVFNLAEKALKYKTTIDDIKQEIFNAIDNVPITLSKNDADNLLKMNIQDIIDKHITEK